MKAVSESLDVAHSQVTARLKQPAPGSQSRRRRALNDAALVEQIKQAIGALPSYGYRRVWGLLRRQHEEQAQSPVNVKRVYRVMRDHDLCTRTGITVADRCPVMRRQLRSMATF
ncbi:TPA: IS3 family transposase [Pseudomonas aeruginosa]|nr:IS3 family transposase [Pseudomonas aeruginosa]